MREVVVTGYGIVSPIGIGVPEFCRNMFAGESGVSAIRGTLVASNFPVGVAARVPRTRLGQPHTLRNLDSATTPASWRLAGIATEEALASLPAGVIVDAIVYATSDGVSFDLFKDSFRNFAADTFDWDSTRSETCLECIRGILEQRGNGRVSDEAMININNACVSGNQAIGIALGRIRSGQWTRALVGGVDARCNDHNLMNFHLLGALTTAEGMTASRPFSKDRSGFVRGEGAATLILEAREAAEARGAPLLGSVIGYSATSDAHRLTQGREDARGATGAIRLALEDAGCTNEQVSAISAHGTSTLINDALETVAIKKVFGPLAYQIPVISLKSQIGHSTVAAGAMEAVASLLMLREQRLAPTINLKQPDPLCDLDYVPNFSRPAVVDVVLSNNFGFGGQNSCVVFKRASA
ncbi:MAG TPA: beta-ketoacyl-[acyl-carrier-protein] synthase family protein [Candidatus Angelobacter sp.]|nr:beta-ketoacyl-[acyl-carrier-protein] synthase family protein [Candidatus Angelobacter sp.]